MYTSWYLEENENKLRDATLKSKSIAETARHLGLRAAGGNYRTLKFHIFRLAISTDHHLGQAWNRENYRGSGYRNNESWRKYLISKRGHKCENCKGENWNGKLIPLELEHIDGNSSNYDEHNLLLLCNNCHAQTKTWRRPKRGCVSQR